MSRKDRSERPAKSEGERSKSSSRGEGSRKPSSGKRFVKRSSDSKASSSSGERRRPSRPDDKRDFRKTDSDNSTEKRPRRTSGSDEKRSFRKSDSAYGEERGERRPRKTSGSDGKRSFRKSDSAYGEERGERRPRKTGREEKSFKKDFPAKRTYQKSKPAPSAAYYGASKSTAASSGLIRLNRYISNAGICSRREADELIKQGLITVNGTVITEMGFKVKPSDEVRYQERRLKPEKPVYILMNKPKGFITTSDDEKNRKTVMDLVANACSEKVYPVGRLDRNTTGLLLLTNDGELTQTLTHPSYRVRKVYKVELNRALTKADFQEIADGVRLEEGRAQVDDIAYVDNSKKVIGIELHIGWNRIVRRIFEALGYEVVKLDRVVYAGLDKKDLPRGQWRFLSKEEVLHLKHFTKNK